MSYADYMPVTGTILSITGGENCCNRMISLRSESGIVNFIIDSDTRIIDNRQLWRGMRVMAFYDSSLPVPMIFPPQYRAQIITALGRNEQVMLARFNRNLVSDDRTLQLNIAGNTVIQTINGQSVDCNLSNHDLLVFYSATTRSIPPQTTPRKIIVLC